MKLLDQDAIIKVVEKRASDVVNHISSKLGEKVYREKDIQVVKNTRVLLGAHSLLQSVVARGAPIVANLTWDKFFASSVEVDSSLMQRVSEQEFKDQFREYVRRLESLTRTEEK